MSAPRGPPAPGDDSVEAFSRCVALLRPPLDGAAAAALRARYVDFHRDTRIGAVEERAGGGGGGGGAARPLNTAASACMA